MKITEDEREKVSRELESLNRDLWLKLVSQVHYHGDEANFWFLVSDPALVPLIIPLVLGPMNIAAGRFDETKFFVSFSQKTDTNRVVWEDISDDEVRLGRVDRPLCSHPAYFKLHQFDVFGVNSKSNET